MIKQEGWTAMRKKKKDHTKATRRWLWLKLNRTPPRHCVVPVAVPSSCSLIEKMRNNFIKKNSREFLLARFSRTSFAASTLAGLSRLGVSDDSIEITLRSYANNLSKLRVAYADPICTHNGFYSVDRQPALARIFVTVLVITRRMLWINVLMSTKNYVRNSYAHQDRDANSSIRVNCIEQELVWI